MSLSQLSGSEVASVASCLQAPADKYVNEQSLEVHWAMQAFHHAETYFNLITSVDPTILKLTRVDDAIYTMFREDFKDLDVEMIKEDEIKSPSGKERWRSFCNTFERKVEDWNMGTLLRLNSTLGISEDNTTIVPRIQFLAIEVARNREGYNAGLRDKYSKKSSTPAPEKDS